VASDLAFAVGLDAAGACKPGIAIEGRTIAREDAITDGKREVTAAGGDVAN